MAGPNGMVGPNGFLKLFLIMCIITVEIVNSQDSTKRSLAIVFDVTASMTDEINSLREGVILLLQTFTSRPDNPISEYIFVQFRDEERESVILPPIVENDSNKIYKHLETFGINGGRNGDCLESCFRGIKYGLELAKENSIMFVFTDAGTKHKEMKSELEKLIQRKKITVYFFLTAGCGRGESEIQYYRDLATSSNGLVFDVDHRQIREHFPKYREVINDKLGLNDVVTGPAGRSNVSVDVDSSMKEFTFTIVAQKPLVTIYDPQKNLIQDFEILTDLPTIKMIQVKNPISGQWTIQVEATTPYTGQVSVLSDLSFKYGFAVHEPSSMAETSFSPMIGQNNYLAILPSDSTLIGTLEYVLLNTKSGPHKFILRKKIVAEGDLYITDSIRLPNEAFKVVLHGIDPLNHAIKRLLSPDIAPRQPDKPETANIPKLNIQEGDPIYLICRVDSMVDIKISWWKVGESTALKSLESKQSNILNHTIAVAELSDSGDYMCVAENSAGKTESKTVVDVRKTLLNVNAPIKQYTPKLGSKLVLKCVVIPRSSTVRVSWLFNGSPNLPKGSMLNLPNLILNNIDRSCNGTYTCVAERKTEIMQDNIEVNVQYSAKILNIFRMSPYGVLDHTKPIKHFDQSQLKILCGFEGNPKADTKWINNNGVIVSNTPSLVVNGNDIGQAGYYYCQVENTVGKDEKRIQIDITIKPKLLASYETNYRVKLGSQFTLECPVEVIPNNEMQIVWYRNGSQVQQELISNDRIKIDKVDHIDNGNYKCKSSNNAGFAEAEFIVEVQYTASILNIVKRDDIGSIVLDSSVTKVDIFRTSSLTCIVNGNPPPTVVWKKDGSIVSTTNQLDINPLDTSLSTNQLAGNYLCEVENLAGKDEKYIQIDITIKPKLLPRYETQYRVKRGEQFTLECPLEIIPNNKMEIVWYRNGSQIDQALISNDRIKIDKVDHIDNGNYKCRANNDGGSVEVEFTVEVQYTASILNIVKRDNIGTIVLDPSMIKLEIINATTLTCMVSGNPPPTVVWKKDDSIVSTTNQLDINPLDTSLSTSQLAGNYLCEVENLAGKDEKYIQIDITIKPKLLPRYETQYRVKRGEQFTLECPLEIIPNNKMEIVWYRNESQIDQALISNDRIKIDKVDHIDNGNYKCRANNDGGSVEVEFTVEVQYTASILNIVKRDNIGTIVLDPSIRKLEIINATTLTCVVSGNPQPTVVWKKNGLTVSRTNQLDINPLTNRLTASQLAGNYLCEVENLAGKDEEHIKIDITIKPKLLARYETKYQVKLGDQFTLGCPLEIIPNNNMEIVWYRNGSQIQQRLISNERIKIDKVDHVDNGNYKCRASNAAGAVEAEFTVDVQYTVRILNIVKRDDTGTNVLHPSITRLEIFNVTTFSLTCNVNGNPRPVTVWKKNGIVFSRSNHLNINPKNTGFSGTYECSTQNVLNSDERLIELIEIVKPKLTQYTILQNLTENSEFRLTCPVGSGDFQFTWYFNNNNFDSYKQADGSLYIDQVYPNMTGDAYCVAANKAGTAVAQFKFNVWRLPYDLSMVTSSYKNPIEQISPNKKQIAFIKNEPLDLKCNAQGNPKPILYWLKDDRMYSSDGLIEIQSMQTQDAATYSCIAENLLGNRTEQIAVVVYEPPYLLSTTGLENGTNQDNLKQLGITVLNRVQVPNTYFKANYEQIIKVNEGEAVKLDCNMNGNPKPTVNWFKNDVILSQSNAVLEFTSAKVEDSGMYKCVGDNGYGIMMVLYYVNVQKPISILSATSTKSVYEQGDEIKFTCKTKGNQLPVIVWRGLGDSTDNENIFKTKDDELRKQLLQQNEAVYLNGRQLLKPTSGIDPMELERYGKISYEFLDGEYIGTLEYVIKSAQFSDAGQYKCISRIFKVKNTQVDKIVTIEVVNAPYLENAETKYSILQGINSHKIKCPIRGIPNPSIEWYRKDSVITSNEHFDIQNNFLDFKKPMLHQGGDYSCRGTNKGGTVEFKFKVIIFTHIADISNIVLNRSRKTKVTVEKNETKELECSFKQLPIYWSKIIDAYPNKQRQLLEANTTYNFFADVSEIIMCSKDADPQYGEIFEITVLEKPNIRPVENNVEVKLNDNLRLQCDATGEPKPTIKWYKYVGGQRYDIHNYPEFEVSDTTLIKRRAENSDTTKYVCIAKNNIGMDSNVFDVIVLNDSHYFSPWSDWSICSETCGEGVQFRTRDCIHASCNQTREREEQTCKTIDCPIDGGWSVFSPFSACSKSCVIDLADVPTKQAKRECNNPAPAFGGKRCIGKSVRILNCTVPLCESVLTIDDLDYSACSNQEICCPAGFVYDNKTGGCPDIDKCARKGPYSVCQTDSQTCHSIGKDDYECICKPGFKLKPPKRGSPNLKKQKKYPNCVDINECKSQPYPCGDKKCANNRGSYSCI